MVPHPRAVLRLMLLALALVLPGAALSHAQLQEVEPPAGAVLDAAPAKVVLRFNEAVGTLQSRWFLPDGAVVEAEARAEGRALIVTAPAELPEGTHALSWRVVSADGHPVGGTHVFSVGTATDAPEVAEAAVPWPAAVARALLTLTLAFGVGPVVWAALGGGPVWRGARALAVAAVPAAALLLGAQAMDLAGTGAAALARPADWAAALAGLFGAMAALAGAAGLVAAWAAGRSPLPVAPGLVAGALAALSFAAAGHAARADPVGLMAGLVVLHAGLAILWAGALPGLLAGLGGPEAAARLRRFSRLALPAVLLMLGAGAVLAVRLVSELPALWKTGYGLLLLAKLAAVVLLLGLALRHRTSLTPWLEADPVRARPVFARSLRMEVAVMVVLLALTSGFRLTSPPATAPLPPPPVSETEEAFHLHEPEASANVILRPGRAGANRVAVEAMDGFMDPIEPQEVTLRFSRPADGIEPITARAELGEDGLWHVDEVYLPPGGHWTLRLEFLITDFRMETLETTVDLAP